MDPEHRQPATPVGSLSPAAAGTPRPDAGPVVADLDEDLWLEREQEYAELGGEG